jgi:hypothetical protein
VSGWRPFLDADLGTAMTAQAHGENNSQRAYLVSIASISGIPKCSRAGPSRAKSRLSSKEGALTSRVAHWQFTGQLRSTEQRFSNVVIIMRERWPLDCEQSPFRWRRLGALIV